MTYILTIPKPGYRPNVLLRLPADDGAKALTADGRRGDAGICGVGMRISPKDVVVINKYYGII